MVNLYRKLIESELVEYKMDTEVTIRETDEYSWEAVRLAEKVKREGYPNAYGAHIPIKSKWNLDKLRKMLVGYGDQELIEFLTFGWPANRLLNMPPQQ